MERKQEHEIKEDSQKSDFSSILVAIAVTGTLTLGSFFANPSYKTKEFEEISREEYFADAISKQYNPEAEKTRYLSVQYPQPWRTILNTCEEVSNLTLKSITSGSVHESLENQAKAMYKVSLLPLELISEAMYKVSLLPLELISEMVSPEERIFRIKERK